MNEKFHVLLFLLPPSCVISMSKEEFYKEDLAYIHDEGYSGFSVDAASFVLHYLQEKNITTGKIIDLGCGSGQLLKAIAEQGYETIGVEYSNAILKLAQKASPKTTFYCQSLWDYELPKCQVVTLIGEILNYTFDRQNNSQHLLTLFKNIYAQLPQKGIFVGDVLTTTALKKEYDYKIVKGKDWVINIEYFGDFEAKTLTRDITVFREIEPNLYRKSNEIHQVNLFDKNEIESLLKQVGFEVRCLASYGGELFREGHVGFLAVK